MMKHLPARITRTFMLGCLTLAAACGPVATDTALETSQTIKGITLSVTDIHNSLLETTLTILIQADSQWNVSVDSDPPAIAMVNNPILFNETGTQFNAHSSNHGIAQVDESTGGTKFENTITFDPANGDSLTFQTEIEIEGIPISPLIEVSVMDHQVLDVWPLDQSLSFSEFTNLAGDVRLVSRSATNLELEFTFARLSSDGLELSCLHFRPVGNPMVFNYLDCTSDQDQIVSRLGIPPDVTQPLSIRVTGSVLITEPFTVPVP